MNSPLVNNQLIECVLNETRRILNEEGVIMAALKDILRGSMEGDNQLQPIDTSWLPMTATSSAATGQGLIPKQNVATMTIEKATRRTPDRRWDYSTTCVQPYGYNKYGGMCATGVAKVLRDVFGLNVSKIGNGGRDIPNMPMFTYIGNTTAQAGYDNPQNGDVAVFKNHLHVCVFVDGHWVSDTIQNSLNCYRTNDYVSIYRPNLNNQA